MVEFPLFEPLMTISALSNSISSGNGIFGAWRVGIWGYRIKGCTVEKSGTFENHNPLDIIYRS